MAIGYAMLKKNKPLKLMNPNSTMRLVYESIRDGNYTPDMVRVDTKKFLGPVKAAIYNLSHIGMIKPVTVNGRTHWYLPDSMPATPIVAAPIFSKCSSIFSVGVACEK